MSYKKGTYGEKFLRISVRIRGEHMEFLKTLKKLNISMSEFVKDAISYYLPIYKEKIQIEVLERYQKLLEIGNRWDK